MMGSVRKHIQEMHENSEKWEADLQKWESDNIDKTGRYVGDTFNNIGFSWRRGEYVPVNERYSCFLEWTYARKVRELTEYRLY